MARSIRSRELPVFIAGLCVWAVANSAAAQASRPAEAGPSFVVKFESGVSAEPYTGRLYVALCSAAFREPAKTINFIEGGPFFARDVENWKPGEPLELNSANTLGYPDALARLAPGTYSAQAVIDLNRWSPEVLSAARNGVSDAVRFVYKVGETPTIALTISRETPAETHEDSDDLKWVRRRSDLMSRFYGREVFLRAVVQLPSGYDDEPKRRYPTVYIIPGFDGSLHEGLTRYFSGLIATAGLDAVVVNLDATCPTGHHVFADSANNGPWGQALVAEFIPYLEREFRLIPQDGARFVMGHSSGGWSSLWLQISYPETFGGTWSSSPDPVDFSAFMMADIYAPDANMFVGDDGAALAVSRRDFMDPIIARDLSNRERVLGRGGQLGSFAAVFGPRGKDGQPVPLWDRETGKIDPDVAKYWRKYDIRLIIQNNWPELGPKLKGKLHLICGERDTFYLERAFVKLRDTLKSLGSDAQVEVIPNATHTLPPRILAQMCRDMKTQFERWQRAQKQP